MALLVYSVVRRHMKETSPNSFTRYAPPMAVPTALPLAAGETLVGWYRNPAPWEDEVVFFTSAALYVAEGGEVSRIALTDIVDYESPPSKVDITGVRIRTKDGLRFVRVAGSFGPFGNRKDAFSFIMVIQAVAHANRVAARRRGAN